MVKKTVRDQVYTTDTYLKRVNDGDVCENADVQRLAGNYDKREANEMVYTTLTGDHMPELILAECNEDNHTYIADGLQRTTILKAFRYGNYKISSAIDNPIIEYTRKKRDKDGKVIRNSRGQVEFEDATYDIRNKTYDMLPEELKKEFDDFQLRVVIHEDCTMKRISELIKRYNYQRPMTASQKAFTYIDEFAVLAREISNKRFFIECEGYTEAEKINGTMERVVTESVMCLFHLDNWKKSSKAVCQYLNEESSEEEFEEFGEIVERLSNIITPEFNSIFTSKNSFIWFKTFQKFLEYGVEDKIFADFIKEFTTSLEDKIVNEVTYKNMESVSYSKLNKEAGTKDKVLIHAKLNILESLLLDYLGLNEEDFDQIDVLEFIQENVDETITNEDINVYKEDLELLTLDVNNDSKLLDENNLPSLLAIIALSYKEDIAIDDWFVGYFKSHNSFIRNQKENFLNMKSDLEAYIAREEAA